MVPFVTKGHKWDQQASVERVTAADLDPAILCNCSVYREAG